MPAPSDKKRTPRRRHRGDLFSGETVLSQNPTFQAVRPPAAYTRQPYRVTQLAIWQQVRGLPLLRAAVIVVCLYVSGYPSSEWSSLGCNTDSTSCFDGASAIKTAPIITRTATPISSPRATMLQHAWVPMSAA